MKSNNLHVGRSPPRGARAVLRAWWPTLLTAAVIFALSSLPASRVPSGWPPGTDKLAHGLVYAVLGALVARSRGLRSPGWSSLRLIVWATLFTTAYGLSDELHQRFVPGRRFELLDLLADGVGGLLGALLMAHMRRRDTVPEPRKDGSDVAQ
jgi:VanZ family protein